MNRTRLQHFVPQFLLRRFLDDSGALAVYDKSSDREFRTGTRAVAAESFFYDVEVGEQVLTLEPALADLEGEAARIVAETHARESLAALSPSDRSRLSIFVAVQALRTQHHRANILHMMSELINRVNKVVPEDQPDATLPTPTEEDAKRMSLGLVVDASKEIAEIIATKPWVLARAPANDLCVGDNPVAMHNDRDFGFYGSIGFAVPGVELHFPLGPGLTLYIPCHTTVAQIRDTVAHAGLLRSIDRTAWTGIGQKVQSLEALLKAVDTGDPIDLRPENVERENSLQIEYAGRWVFSQTGDFELAKRMIDEDPRFRSGPFGRVM